MRQPGIRIRVPEVGAAILVLTTLGCDGGATGPETTGPPILGSCDVVPNYIRQVRLNRWREFPLRYDIIESSFPEENRDHVLARVVDGINQWADLTNGQIGSLVRTSNHDDSDLIIEVGDLRPVAGRTTHVTGSPFLSGGRITFDRQWVIAFSGTQEGPILSALAAHEMGHLLGIIGHPSMQDVLMNGPLQALQPTTADLNTLSHAYCRP